MDPFHSTSSIGFIRAGYVRRVLLFVSALVSACIPSPHAIPEVLGVPFAVPVSAIKQHLPEGAKPENYPLIPLHGYKLNLPNPENWTVLVQEEAPSELLENKIFTIFISRSLESQCTRANTEEFVAHVKKKYQPLFSESFTHRLRDEGASAFMAVSDRKMLTATIRCLAQTLSSTFTYVDLDQYKYRNPDVVRKLISQAIREAKEYESRSFR